MSPSQRYAVFAQTAGLLESRNRQTILDVLSGRAKLSDLMEATGDEVGPTAAAVVEGADDQGDPDTVPPALAADADDVMLIDLDLDEMDTDSVEVFDLAGDSGLPDEEPALPTLTAAQVLDQGAAALIAMADGDAETIAYLIADDVAELWKVAYSEDIARYGKTVGMLPVAT